jgi:type II secretory pathway component GspD/PulD (secretin)
VDESIHATQIRVDMDDATFQQAIRTISMLTNSFYVPLDARHVLVARDTVENRKQFERLEYETVYLQGLTDTELTDIGTLAKNVFEVQQATPEKDSGTLAVRATTRTLNAFNATLRELLGGHSQVMLDVRIIQLARTNERNTGINPPQQITAVNAYSAEQSILNANQTLVQQIISQGLASPGDITTILGILLASGQVSSSLFTNGIVLFGGGLTLSGLSPGPVSANLDLNSSDSRELDQIQLRLGDGEAGSLKLGERYPIQTASYSSVASTLPSIPGLTGAGSSSGLSSLLSSINGNAQNIPQIEYEDLGMTLKATPKVMRNNDVALTIDMKIDALAGSSINGNPVLNNRAYSGVVTLKEGEGVVIINDLTKQESRAISGVPGISEIPGLNNLTGIDATKSYAELLIVMTPHVVRGTQSAGHTPMMRVEKSGGSR